MKNPLLLILLAFTLLTWAGPAQAQIADSSDVYLLTCAPGTESYSIYGHTALRIKIKGTAFDRVYNWGLFDFTTPNFAYRFAKGKLDYMLGAYDYRDFLNEYETEERSVWSQKINLTTEDKKRLFLLINENIKPENIKYRYDFFFDNCATRVRDIIENAVADSLYFRTIPDKKTTFRQLISPFQEALPWLDLGADILLGLQADRKASFRDEMFLPMHMKNNIAEYMVIRNSESSPLMSAPLTEVDFTFKENPNDNHRIPQLILYVVLVFVILVTFVLGVPLLGKITDLIVYTVFSIISLLLIFTNLFSDHDALHFNLLILAFNPLIPALWVFLLMRKNAVTLNKIALVVSVLYFPAALIADQGINPAIIPLVLILIVRIFRHCEFGKSF